MFLVGESLANKVFYSIYAVFDNKSNLKNWLSVFTQKQFENMQVIEFKDLSYPFFVIEEFNNGKSHYRPIRKSEFNEKIKGLKIVDDFNAIYFNLWRFDKNTYNKNFPNEPCLNGRHYHLHFMNSDIEQINLNGIEVYWQEILTA